ncbi:unnamed protein product [Somion occarium]|uniref:NAD(P)-binding domain-containing protein n=1 Tax=Somion occarium TaxID=3059160 RepID=A0ABP1DUC0_9APHY
MPLLSSEIGMNDVSSSQALAYARRSGLFFDRYSISTRHLDLKRKSALIIGATGATGKCLLQELLKSPVYTRVGEFGRRVTSPDLITTGKEKLVQKVIDFENLSESGLKEGNWDVTFITLGTQRATAGSAEAFEKIDRGYVVNAAREAKSNDPSLSQRLVYISSVGANPTSRLLYLRSKGLTELELSKLGYADTIIFRLAMLTGADRPGKGLMASLTMSLVNMRESWVEKCTMPCPSLARAMKNAGVLGNEVLQQYATKDADVPFTLIENHAIRPLAGVSV